MWFENWDQIDECDIEKIQKYMSWLWATRLRGYQI